MEKIGCLFYPHVVEYSYRLLGVFPMRSMTIIEVEKFCSNEEVLKKTVEKKTGRKVVRIISHT